MGRHMSCYGWAWVVVDGCGMGMGTNTKKMVGYNTQHTEFKGVNP